MKDDKFVLVFAIINIVVLTLLMAFITNKGNSNGSGNGPSGDKTPTVVSGSKVCNLSLSDDTKYTNRNRITINYKDNYVTDYSIDYILKYDGSKEYSDEFNEYKNQYSNLVETFQPMENYELSNYYNEKNEYRATLTHIVKGKQDNYLMFDVKTNINDAIKMVTTQGYVCEK